MRILLVNDDGVNAEGINILAECLKTEHDVWIVAPDRNRSAASHAITMTKPLKINKLGDKVFSCSGQPVDCTAAGFHALVNPKPDLVISGINKGFNIGTDIIYSGTCAAARQAAFYGVPAIAVSLEIRSENDGWYFHSLAEFVKENLEKFIALCKEDEEETFININAYSTEKFSDWKLTVPSSRNYHDKITLVEGPDGCTYSFFTGGDISTTRQDNSDFKAVEDGFVSVSKILSQPSALTDDTETKNE